MTKIEFAGTVRGVEFRGVAEFHDGRPGEGPVLNNIVWAEGFDPGLSDDDEEGWIIVVALAYNVLDHGGQGQWALSVDPKNAAAVVW